MDAMLFTPAQIGTLRLPNRIIMSAMHTGLSLEREAAFLAARAWGGAALVTTVLGVCPSGAASDMPVICEENRGAITGMAEAVHEAGGRLSVQLFHAGRNCEEGRLADPAAQPVAPSPVPSPIYRSVPHELTKEEIRGICLAFAKSAGLCRACGVDVLEISCSAGYLLSQFLSPLTNLRTDDYGGDFAHRARMPLEAIQAVRTAVGEGFPLILRVSGADMLGGYGISETQELVGRAAGMIDAFSVTGGWHESRVPQISMDLPEGGFSFLARSVRQVTDKPVVACNRIGSMECAEALLQAGDCDFVGCARAFLTDPDFARKLRSGTPYMKCIGCNKGCIENVLRHRPATCVFNPLVGHENSRPPSMQEKERILVVGSGPAGLTAAAALARTGYQVTLCEKEKGLGGLLRFAGITPHKEAILHNMRTLIYQAELSGVRICPGTNVDEAYLRANRFDRVLVAEGLAERRLSIDGAERQHVYTAEEVLSAESRFLDRLAGQHVCIIGGGSVAAELAQYIFEKTSLSQEMRAFLGVFASSEVRSQLRRKGSVTIIARGAKIARDLGGTRWILMRQLQQFPIEILTNSVVERLDGTMLQIKREQESLTRRCDVLVTAAGYVPRESGITAVLEAMSIPYERIGDCAMRESGIQSAVQSALLAAGIGGLKP